VPSAVSFETGAVTVVHERRPRQRQSYGLYMMGKGFSTNILAYGWSKKNCSYIMDLLNGVWFHFGFCVTGCPCVSIHCHSLLPPYCKKWWVLVWSPVPLCYLRIPRIAQSKLCIDLMGSKSSSCSPQASAGSRRVQYVFSSVMKNLIFVQEYQLDNVFPANLLILSYNRVDANYWLMSLELQT